MEDGGARPRVDPAELVHTSLPPWARGVVPSRATSATGADGAAHLLVGVGSESAPVLARWAAELGAGRAAVRVLRAPDGSAARALLAVALARARVGVRVWVSGPVGACLTLRATALAAGLADDELVVVPVGNGPIDVACVHCGRATEVEAEIGDTIACAGCGRPLLVFEHVSRRLGSFLGFQADAGGSA
ncbi:dimethylamine monooxygenase subunit DmmA family protein [Pseudofrankia inefficax]|uniref:Dimethylamine monooxygenase subunit DmmA-like C-terminal domain-containing protein n=1 Tax=Pseudofrankia inefficax (strain DSM 45817 / CECT 9037 / DDB 130130 / EuI1c) TaxID=298654 RepID=E3JB12_PSEI1|nr:dimethylamine monooxygenase subunit DmmA family protein [Pseudofrankia inefficax]ADP84633.1 hypothetical protein FraEuI1c_6663 [Pseudofrankia inefficax]